MYKDEDAYSNPFATVRYEDQKKPVAQAVKIQRTEFELFRSLILEIAKEAARESALVVIEELGKQTTVQAAYFRVEQAATYIGNTVEGVEALRKKGEIRVSKVGTRIYIAKADLDTWMKNHRI